MGAGRATVAIWGSCVTRDAFALDSRADQLAERLPLVYYGARSSWISQDSRPWPQAEPEFGGDVSGFGLRMVEEDFHKTIIDRLVELQPDLVVLDLVDERLQLARVGKTWITASDYLKRTALGPAAIAGADEVSSVTQPRRPKLFAPAARRLARRMVRELPRSVFVLNEAPYTTRVGGGTSLPEPQAGWARELQAAQLPLLATLVEEFGSRLVRATPPPEVCLAEPSHRWGLSSYHYVDRYYHWLIDTLLEIEPLPARPAAPASPAGAQARAEGPHPASRSRRLRAMLRR